MAPWPAASAGPAQKPRRTPSRTARVVSGPGLRAPVRLTRNDVVKMAASAPMDIIEASVASAWMNGQRLALPPRCPLC
jgi:hypothetical protein